MIEAIWISLDFEIVRMPESTASPWVDSPSADRAASLIPRAGQRYRRPPMVAIC